MLKVLGRSSSHNVQKVMWCLAELGLACERVDIGGPYGGNRDAAYLALNPHGVVPTLLDGETVVWESNTILRYLCSRHPGRLYPPEAVPRSEVERWMDWQLGTLAPAIVPLYQAIVRTLPERRDAGAIEAHRSRTAAAIARLDAALADRAFVAGSALTLADICLGPSAYRWFALPIRRDETPALRRWYETLTQRPAYRDHVMLELT